MCLGELENTHFLSSNISKSKEKISSTMLHENIDIVTKIHSFIKATPCVSKHVKVIEHGRLIYLPRQPGAEEAVFRLSSSD